MEDYEELMLQISDVMREANRVRPELSHEQAVKAIRNIVLPRGKWIGSNGVKYTFPNSNNICSNCKEYSAKFYNFCPNCGAYMER